MAVARCFCLPQTTEDVNMLGLVKRFWVGGIETTEDVKMLGLVKTFWVGGTYKEIRRREEAGGKLRELGGV